MSIKENDVAIDPELGKGVELGTRRSDDYPERVRRYLDQQAKDAARWNFVKNHIELYFDEYDELQWRITVGHTGPGDFEAFIDTMKDEGKR